MLAPRLGRARQEQTDGGHGPFRTLPSRRPLTVGSSLELTNARDPQKSFSPTFIAVRVNVGGLAYDFFTALSFRDHPIMHASAAKPASTKNNAVPLESQREKRNDVGRKFMETNS